MTPDYREVCIRNFLEWLRRRAPYAKLPVDLKPRTDLNRLVAEYLSDGDLEAGRPTAEAYIAAAQDKYGDEGRIEIDTSAVVSQAKRADDTTRGAYVMAWVYVYDSEVKRRSRVKAAKPR